MATDTVRLVSMNPKKRRNPKRRNPTTTRVLGQPFVLPKLSEAASAVTGVAAAATMPKIVASLLGKVGGGTTFAEGGYPNLATAWGVNALIGGLSRRWAGTGNAATFVLASSAVSLMQIVHKATGGKFGLPALPSAQIPLPGGMVPAAGVRAALPAGRPMSSLPAMAGVRRAVGSASQDRDYEGNQVFFSVT